MKDALSSAIAGANVEPYTDSADFTASKSFSMPLYRKIFAVNYQKEFIEKETDPSVITRLVDEAWFNINESLTRFKNIYNCRCRLLVSLTSRYRSTIYYLFETH